MSENEKNVPKRRFKEFENAEAWEHRKFSDLFTTLQNNALSRAELNSEQGMAMNVHYGDVLIKFGERLDVSKEEIPFIIDDTCVSKYQSSFLKNGDVIIADAAEDETVGKCSEIVGLTTQTVISGLHTIPCRPVQVFASGYLGFYMNSNAYHNQLLPLIQGTKVSSISKSALNDTVLIYPKSNEEQTLIAKYFTRLDNLITLHQRKLEKMKALKKAYLTDMFPAEGERKPKLRFAGFTDDWEQRKLGELCDVYDGTHQTPNYQNSGIMFLSVENINSLKSEKFISEEDFIKDFNVFPEKGDVLMTRIGDIGTANVVESNEPKAYYVSLALLKKKSLDPYFLKESISSETVKNDLWKRTLHIAFPKKINKNEIAEVLVPYPEKREEQEQIGMFFKNIDNLITIHQRRVEKLQNIKKAYLNEMFI